MVICQTRKWGNSIGVIIPSDVVKELNISENEQIDININKDSSKVLRQLWEFGKQNKIKITRKRFLELRKEIESKWD